LKLADYECEIIYKPRNINKNLDVLSRNPIPQLVLLSLIFEKRISHLSTISNNLIPGSFIPINDDKYYDDIELLHIECSDLGESSIASPSLNQNHYSRRNAR